MISKDRVKADIGKSRIEIEQARLLVLKTAHLIDRLGAKVLLSPSAEVRYIGREKRMVFQGSMKEIAMIKVVVPSVATRVIDRAIQVLFQLDQISSFSRRK